MGVNNCVDCDEKKAAVDCNCIPVENADGTLQDIVMGCTDPLAANYNALANCDDGSCIDIIAGCMDPTSLNYSDCANADCSGVVGGTDTSCCCDLAGCMDPTATNYNSEACLDDGSCQYPGCTDYLACNYVPQATSDDGSCEYPTSNSTTATECGSYTWSVDGQVYTSSGTYTNVGTNAGGCDHTETLNLTINSATSATSSVTECTTYTWPINGTTYTTAGTYTDVGTNANGCAHTETLNLTLGYAGCTDPLAQNYDSGACSDDGSCIAQVLGCTYGPTGSLPGWNSVIGDGGANSASTWAALYNITDPAMEGVGYNSNATQEDGSCTFCVYGCTDINACNYNSQATCEATSLNPGTGVCTPPAQMDLGATTNGLNDPNTVQANGLGAGNFDCNSYAPYGNNNENYMMGCFPYIGSGNGQPQTGPDIYTGTTAQQYGGHANKGLGGGFSLDVLPSAGGENNGGIRTETYFFELGTSGTALQIGQTYCITWAQIVMKLNGKDGSGVCSDCLMGGWGILLDDTIGYTGGASSPGNGDLNSSVNTTIVSIYDPVHLGDLTQASACYDDWNCEECGLDVAGNPNNANTAGASNGSCSEWETKCVTFTATQTAHTIHMYVITDFNQCTTCNCYNCIGTAGSETCGNTIDCAGMNTGNGDACVHGTYCGISNVNIDVDCAGSGDCDCQALGF